MSANDVATITPGPSLDLAWWSLDGDAPDPRTREHSVTPAVLEAFGGVDALLGKVWFHDPGRCLWGAATLWDGGPAGAMPPNLGLRLFGREPDVRHRLPVFAGCAGRRIWTRAGETR